MRLLKPSFYSSTPCFTEEQSASQNFSKILLDQAFNLQDIKNIKSSANTALTDFLVIPQIFG
jgi:hypothetical protein